MPQVARRRLPSPAAERLLAVLAEGRTQHFLGSGSLTFHVEHSLAFADLISEAPRRAVDLGSGAGVPGLVLALWWPGSTWVLIDANTRRTAFVRDALAQLDLEDRVEVLTERAETVGRDPRWRGRADVVVSRGFGAPAVTAECAAPLLAVGGICVVAEPPGGAPDRWPAEGLATVGWAGYGQTTTPIALQRLRQVEACPARYPRRVGIPQKRPLF